MRGAGSGTFYVSVASILPSKVPACSLLCVCGSGCRSRLWWDMKSPESMGERRVLGSFIPAALGCGWSPWDPEGWLDLKLEGRGEKNQTTTDPFPKRYSSILMVFYIGTNEILKYWSKLLLLINIWQSTFLLQSPKLRGSNENVKPETEWSREDLL